MFFLQDVSVIYKPFCEVSEQIFFFFEYKLSITVPSKSLQRGHESQSVKAHTLPPSLPLPPPLSLSDSSRLVSTGKSQPMKLIVWCVFYEKNSLYCPGFPPTAL